MFTRQAFLKFLFEWYITFLRNQNFFINLFIFGLFNDAFGRIGLNSVACFED